MGEELRQDLHVAANVFVYGFDLAHVREDEIIDYRPTNRHNLSQSQKNRLESAIIYYQEGHNLLVNAGLNLCATQLTGETTAPITHSSVGTSGAANSAAMTDLTTPISPRLTITYKYYEANGKAHFDTSYGGSDNAGIWAEVGLFTAITGGTMLARKLLSPTFTKINSPDTGANAALVSWIITFTATGT